MYPALAAPRLDFQVQAPPPESLDFLREYCSSGGFPALVATGLDFQVLAPPPESPVFLREYCSSHGLPALAAPGLDFQVLAPRDVVWSPTHPQLDAD